MPQQPFALPGIVLALWAAIRRRWRLFGVTICAIAVFAFGILGLSVSFPREPTGARLRVMTYNVHSCEHGAAPIADVIMRESPDVVVLQETRAMYGVDPVTELTASLAGWRVVSAGDVAIATRCPIQSFRSHAMPMSNRRALEASVKIGAKSVTIIAAHLSTSPTDESLSRLRRPLSEYMRRSADIRMKQAAALKAIADASREPVVIAGDLNTPPRGLVYSGLRRGYTDAFAACGFGRGLTYPSRRSLMRIDYVFAGPGIDPVKCYVPDTRASDHRPVVVDLSIE